MFEVKFYRIGPHINKLIIAIKRTMTFKTCGKRQETNNSMSAINERATVFIEIMKLYLHNRLQFHLSNLKNVYLYKMPEFLFLSLSSLCRI